MTSEHEPTSAAERASELSADVIQALEDSGRAAIDAVKGFLSTVEEALPQVEGARKVEKQITDSALEMAEQLVHTQSEFLRKVVSSAGKTRTSTPDGK
jgi:exonuclease VII large subunit